jgi:hypothetical protein
MAKAKTCAYHLCDTPLDRADYRAQYCRPQCYRNAKQWRWRHRKPAKRAAEQHRWWKRKQRENVKKTYADRRRPLAARVEKKAAKDSRESSADQVA